MKLLSALTITIIIVFVSFAWLVGHYIIIRVNLLTIELSKILNSLHHISVGLVILFLTTLITTFLILLLFFSIFGLHFGDFVELVPLPDFFQSVTYRVRLKVVAHVLPVGLGEK